MAEPAIQKENLPDKQSGQAPTSARAANTTEKPKHPPKRPFDLVSLEIPIITTLVGILLLYAWSQKDEGHITAETGLGYYLGIIGSILMLTLLLYPLRKRIKILRFVGSVRGWFRVHMLLGIIGPALVLLHSNFTLGSLNSRVALWAMVIVATSGFAGRFFYRRIHRGLYGHKHNLKEIVQDVIDIKNAFATSDEVGTETASILSDYEESRLNNSARFWRSFEITMTGPFSRRKLRKSLRRTMQAELKKSAVTRKIARSNMAKFDESLDRYLRTLARAEAFSLYERLFALWHMFHLPLFIILVLAALVHVVAVHLY